MTSSYALRIRLGALALAAAGLLFILYPALRPWHDESTVDGAIASMDSGAWLAAHLFAMLGFILVALGLLAVRQVITDPGAERTAFAAVVTGWVGAGLTLPFYGAETFALNAIAGRAAQGEQFDLLEMIEAVQFGPLAATTFGIGLLGLAVAGVLAAVAVWRSGNLPRYSGLPFAVGLALFLPQFFTPPAARITHGVVLGLGAMWLALVVWRAAPPAVRTDMIDRWPATR
jgi:hypothetical protein